MATAAASASPLGGIADLLTKVLPMVTGSKSSATESTVTDPGTMQGIQQLLSSIMPLASGKGLDSYMPLLTQALDTAKQQILPIVGQQGGAGLYRSTPVTDFGGRMGAKAVNDAFGQILQAQGQAQQSAAQLLMAQGKLNSTTTKTAATPGNPLLQAASAAATGYGIGQKLGIFGGKKPPVKGKDGIDDIIQSAIDGGAMGDSDKIIAEAIKMGGEAGGTAVNSAASFGENFSSLAGYDVGSTAGLLSETFGLSEGAGALGAASDLAGGLGIAELGGAAAGELGTSLFAGAGAEALGFDLLGGELGAAAGLGPWGFAIPVAAALVGDDSVICTEARRQGLMSPTLYLLETTSYLPTLSPVTVSGYQFLAAPAVRWMKRSKLAARFFAAGARAYAAHTTGYQRNLIGAIIKTLGEPLSYLVGRLINSGVLAHG